MFVRQADIANLLLAGQDHHHDVRVGRAQYPNNWRSAARERTRPWNISCRSGVGIPWQCRTQSPSRAIGEAAIVLTARRTRKPYTADLLDIGNQTVTITKWLHCASAMRRFFGRSPIRRGARFSECYAAAPAASARSPQT